MFNLGPMEVLVIVVVALVVLGPQRLPEAMRQLGKGVGDLRRWSSQLTSEVQSAFIPGHEEPAPARASLAQAATPEATFVEPPLVESAAITTQREAATL